LCSHHILSRQLRLHDRRPNCPELGPHHGLIRVSLCSSFVLRLSSTFPQPTCRTAKKTTALASAAVPFPYRENFRKGDAVRRPRAARRARHASPLRIDQPRPYGSTSIASAR
jgi:hypothetical protein